MTKPAIICVDDEPIVLESLKIELKQTLGDSYVIETAESGEEALELFEELQTDQHEVAVVLADQSMPGLRGDELLKQIHAVSPQTLSIMITGHADLETISTVLRTAKLYCYIPKPWQSDDLRTAVLNAIQSYRQTRELEIQNATLQEAVQQLEQSMSQLQQNQVQVSQQAQQHETLSRVFLAFAMQQLQTCQSTQEQVATLEHLNQVKDHFLDAISHELRAPISNIRMATQMLEVRLQQLELDDSVLQCDRYFRILKTECQREVDLLTDLLTLIRLDSNADPLKLSVVNLQLWIPHIVEPFLERMQERHQHLEIYLPSSLPSLTTDLSHLERLLSELLNHGCQYTPSEETLALTVQLMDAALPLSDAEASNWFHSPVDPAAAIHSLSISAQQPEVWISVSYTGSELSPQEQAQIFDQFYRLPNPAGWSQTGTGLGMAIAKKRVEKLRGSITVTSENQQTTFTVRLPLNINARHSALPLE